MKRHFFDNLESKTVIVAGGNGLIGSAVVGALKNCEAKVINADIRNPRDEYLNLSNQANLKIFLDRYYPIGGFVDCTYPKEILDASENWYRSINLIAEQLSLNGGSIVCMSSIYGLVGPSMEVYDFNSIHPPTLQYAFCKAGIIGVAKHIAVKYGKYNVRCNVICPGGVYDRQPQEFVKKYEKRVPMGRMAVPDDIVGAVLFLISDWSKYITGAVIPVDGGLTTW